MSRKGVIKPNLSEWITLACGHTVLYSPPLPSLGDQLTCGRCRKSTHVVSSPRRWTA